MCGSQLKSKSSIASSAYLTLGGRLSQKIRGLCLVYIVGAHTGGSNTSSDPLIGRQSFIRLT